MCIFQMQKTNFSQNQGFTQAWERYFYDSPLVTIITYPGSSAETYAKKYKLNYKLSLEKPKLITLNKTKATMYQKASTKYRSTLQLKATPNWSASKLEWTSSDPTVAKVNAKGLVTALKAGKTTITVSANGAKASCVITVKKNDVPISSLTAKPTKVTLKVGEKATINLTYKPATAYNNTIKWTSSNKKIATVTSTGVVTAKKKGSCKIQAQSASGKKVSIKVTVK